VIRIIQYKNWIRNMWLYLNNFDRRLGTFWKIWKFQVWWSLATVWPVTTPIPVPWLANSYPPPSGIHTLKPSLYPQQTLFSPESTFHSLSCSEGIDVIRVSVLRVLPSTVSHFPNRTISPPYSTAIAITIASQTHIPPSPLSLSHITTRITSSQSPHQNNRHFLTYRSTVEAHHSFLPTRCSRHGSIAAVRPHEPKCSCGPIPSDYAWERIICDYFMVSDCFQLPMLMLVRCSRGFTHEFWVMAFQTGFRVRSLFWPYRK
jgi:hypothetical protein